MGSGKHPTLQKSRPTLQERKSGQLFLAETFVTLRWNSNGLEKLETATIVKCTMKVTGNFFSHRVLLDPLLQLRLRDVVSLDVVGDQILVRQRLGVADGLQLEDELPEVELHQRAALIAALLRAREPESLRVSLNGLEK